MVDPESDPGHTLACARREQEQQRRERATRETEPPESEGASDVAPGVFALVAAAVALEEQESLPRREMRALCALVEGATAQPGQVQAHLAALVSAGLVQRTTINDGSTITIEHHLTERGRICRQALERMFAVADRGGR